MVIDTGYSEMIVFFEYLCLLGPDKELLYRSGLKFHRSFRRRLYESQKLGCFHPLCELEKSNSKSIIIFRRK